LGTLGKPAERLAERADSTMRGRWKIATALPLAMFVVSAHAAEPKVAIFDFELVDTSLEGATYGKRPDQQQRLARATDQLRDRLAKSGRVEVIDTAAVAKQADAADLRTCEGCDAKFAREVGADYSIVGWVQKVSNLILNMNITVRDARSGQVVAAKSVDMRDNTDETWARAVDWLVRYDLLADGGTFK
jgi:hypothetical protein